MHIALNKPKQLVVGLTGGIGSGKTAVSSRLQTLGATIIDTDEIAHSLTKTGGLAIPDIQKAFGREALLPDGSMNRDHMRALVFKEPEKRIALEKILHPKIRQLVQQQLDTGATLYFVLVVPLLFEKGGWGELMDEIIVVDCPVEQQVQRVIQRNGWPETQVRAVIQNQATREKRLAGATEVIENNGGLAELIKKIDFLHQKLIKKAQK
ncbi:dephospho-CoA kinase [Limnobacter sp. MED105]|uniref:dephospho-CoA kinase n=1 Tax=unclassified Limnobacter TaxID=2630203 RepID=UPI000156C228|nr:dephospho-CoA kinase [Limnobacter sp. MED105]EDM83308.1 predicted dephospho-CoA kinase [Limnobacter sp. MED105]